MINKPKPLPLDEALARYRRELSRAQQEREEQAHLEAQRQAEREAETARRAVIWIEEMYHITLPVELIACKEERTGGLSRDGRPGYRLIIAERADSSSVLRLNAYLYWKDDALELGQLFGPSYGERPTWHAYIHEGYIDADFLPALDYVFNRPEGDHD